MESDIENPPRPKFKHVQPSGRGMQSEHELEAKRAAVELIEKRIDHNERVRKTAARKRALASVGSIVFGLSVLAGIAYYFAYRSGNSIGMPDLKVGLEGVAKAAQGILPMSGTSASGADAKFRDRYVSVAKEFAKGELAYWKDAPKNLKPKNAPAGTAYHALVPKGGKFDLYELKVGGEVAELSPFGKPVALTTEDFKKAVGGKPYFIACAGRVFVCGGGDLKMMDELRKALLPR